MDGVKAEMAEQFLREKKEIDRSLIQLSVQRLEIGPEEFIEKAINEVKFTIEKNLKLCTEIKFLGVPSFGAIKVTNGKTLGIK